MPIYEFECPIHGKFEHIVSLDLYERTKNGVMCEQSLVGNKVKAFCTEIAVKVVSVPSPPYIAKPTIIFKNPRTGERQVATSKYDTPPRGFVRDELRGTKERSQFEREETVRANVEAQLETHRIREKSNQMRKARQDDMIATMHAKQVDIHPDTGEKIEYHIDHNTEQLLKKAMKRNATKNRIPTKVVERRLAVNHMDSSNMIDTPK